MARRTRRIVPIDRLGVKAIPDNVTGVQVTVTQGEPDPLGGKPAGYPNSIDTSFRDAQPGDNELVDPSAGNDITWGQLFGRDYTRQRWHINERDRSTLLPNGADAAATRAHLTSMVLLERTEELTLANALAIKSKGVNSFLRLLRAYGRGIREATGRDIGIVYLSERTEVELRRKLEDRPDVIRPDMPGTFCGCIVRINPHLKIGEFYATIE